MGFVNSWISSSKSWFGVECWFWAYGVVLKISITLSLENKKPTKTDWNWNTPKPIDFQLFWSVSVENFTNQNIRFRLAIPIQTDRNRTEHTPSSTIVANHVSLHLQFFDTSRIHPILLSKCNGFLHNPLTTYRLQEIHQN